MEKKFVITIGRQYGSGGREVGIHLAKLLNIGFYDKKLISEAARISGLSDKLFEQKDEKFPGSLIHALSFGMAFKQVFSPESIFKIQSDVIKHIATKESCVIVGRSADYILRDNPLCYNIFIHAPYKTRIQRVMERRRVNHKEAAEIMHKIDKERAAYYDFYTEKQWSASESYHLSIDSSILGLEKTAEYIMKFVLEATKND